jgi:hypothetical protein
MVVFRAPRQAVELRANGFRDVFHVVAGHDHFHQTEFVRLLRKLGLKTDQGGAQAVGIATDETLDCRVSGPPKGSRLREPAASPVVGNTKGDLVSTNNTFLAVFLGDKSSPRRKA